MRKITVSPMDDEFAMQMLDQNYKMSVPEITNNCIFHKWTTKLHEHPANDEYLQEQDYALVEMPDGKMQYFRPEQISFQAE